jgi:hypothetical protein
VIIAYIVRTMNDLRLDFPATGRNSQAICDVLSPHLAGKNGDVLEIGSGSGQHAMSFAKKFPSLTFWPTDLEPRHLASIDAWQTVAGLANLRPAKPLDILASDWGLGSEGMAPTAGLAAMICINVIHISPWTVAEQLLQRAEHHLAADGFLYLYGPYKRGGQHTAESNARFDVSLKSRNPAWGVRDMEEIESVAGESGLLLRQAIEMPANNFSLLLTP